MFSLPNIAEYFLISLAMAALCCLCTFKLLGGLQQLGYDGKKYARWLTKKGEYGMVAPGASRLSRRALLGGARGLFCLYGQGGRLTYLSFPSRSFSDCISMPISAL